MKKIVCVIVFLLYSVTQYSQELTSEYTTTVSSENQQIVKGLGGGLPWPQASIGFPITNHPEGMKILLDMGISVARIYWHNQYQIFDKNGNPTERGKTMIDGFIKEVHSTDIPGFTVVNATAMNAAAFVSPDKTVVVLVNSTSDDASTKLSGLYGKKAEVFQIDGSNKELFNTNMTLIDTPEIKNGTIGYIRLLHNTITIIVTDGGY